MHESNVWGAQRFTTLFIVLALHLAFLALFLTAPRTRIVADSTIDSVEVTFFPPAKVPKVRFEKARLQRLSADNAISVTLPGVSSPSLSPPVSGADGDGAGVNWAAEAHRAVQAFEIRRNHPPSVAISGSTLWTDWWPREHHAGDRFKTDSGDWIVWISASCYQVATVASGTTGSAPSQIICPGQPKTARDERLPVSKKLPRPEG
jgi:hypothetical protein